MNLISMFVGQNRFTAKEFSFATLASALGILAVVAAQFALLAVQSGDLIPNALILTAIAVAAGFLAYYLQWHMIPDQPKTYPTPDPAMGHAADATPISGVPGQLDERGLP